MVVLKTPSSLSPQVARAAALFERDGFVAVRGALPPPQVLERCWRHPPAQPMVTSSLTPVPRDADAIASPP
jgi:hypothetical protein